MAGHLDLGDHRDVQRIGVGHHLADLLLGIEAAVGIRILLAAIGTASGIEPLLPRLDRTPGGNLRQLGIAVDLDAPAAAVGQMPVQAVEFERGHHPQLFFHKLLAEEVARLVEMHTAVAEARRIDDALGRDFIPIVAAKLQQGLQPIEETRLTACPDYRTLGKDRKFIPLLRGGHALLRRKDKTQGGILRHLRRRQRRRPQRGGQCVGNRLRGVERHGKRRRDPEGSGTFLDRGGPGYDNLGILGRSAAGDGRERQYGAGKTGNQESEACFLHVLLG